MINIYLNKKIIASNAKQAKNIFSQAFGLRFKKQQNLIFDFKTERKEIIDMFFVFYPIDIIFLDENKKITELKENFRPWKIYKMKNKARFMLELKNGTISNNNVKVSDKIKWI
jgi:uncharacterized membrane protein (UPF0127 family)|tara:strand:+ start:2191 stop:2529 length:339 start_codon:yes stop_codon:yes gene_type:complete